MLHLAIPLDTSDALLMSDDEIKAVAAPLTGIAHFSTKWQHVRLSDRLTMPHLMALVDRGDPDALELVQGTHALGDEYDAANEPLLSVVEVFVAPDDSYDTLDLDPDLYGCGVPATEAETMAAPFDWDAMTEGAAA